MDSLTTLTVYIRWCSPRGSSPSPFSVPSSFRDSCFLFSLRQCCEMRNFPIAWMWRHRIVGSNSKSAQVKVDFSKCEFFHPLIRNEINDQIWKLINAIVARLLVLWGVTPINIFPVFLLLMRLTLAPFMRKPFQLVGLICTLINGKCNCRTTHIQVLSFSRSLLCLQT